MLHGSFPSGRSLDALRRDLGTGRWERARADLFEALRTQLQAPAPRLPDGLSADDHPFFMLLSGLISVADWIGSSEVHFPFAPDTTDPTAYLADAREKARCALDELGWTGWAPPAEPANFGDLFPGLAPRPMQAQVAGLCEEMDGPGLVLIEAPMGEGKTEAAFLLADHWNHALRQRGCYVAMPTQATANAMFARFRDGYLVRRHPQQASRLQLLHGNAVLSRRVEQLAQVGQVHGEGDASGRDGATEAREWFSHRKRGLLGPFAVGTVDQALLGVLQTRHVFVRLFGLADKTLVLDEVHAFDTYTSELIDRLLAWAGALGCSVVLLSATLPRKRREELMRAYAGAETPVPQAAYPRVTWAGGGGVGAAHVPTERGRRVRVEWAAADIPAVADRIAGVIAEGGCVGWVCNTVDRSQQAAIAMREALHGTGAECDLFHARFPFSERDRREKRALERFGKQEQGQSRRPHAAVLVATQVIEQSLDVDFDLLVTDVAPVDLLLQRSGRMHRHDLARPEGLRDPTVWIVSPESDEDGLPTFGASKYVYGEWLLLRTWMTLQGRDTLQVADDVEGLIEDVYGGHGELPDDAMGKRLRAAQAEELARREKLDQAAQQAMIRKPQYADGFLHFVEEARLRDEEDPELHRAFRAMTRYEERPSVTLICLRQRDGAVTVETDGEHLPLDLDAPPDDKMLDHLLGSRASVSHAGITRHFMDSVSRPEAWKRTPLLRYAYPAVFDEHDRLQAGRHELRLDEFLGLVIGRRDNEEDAP